MSGPFRFIHASDLHLERPPRGLAEVPDLLRPLLVDAPFRAAERVFDAAIKERVDFVVLAGDVIDPLGAGPRGLVFLVEQFQRLASQGIRVYWAGGRSDDFERWTDAWPLGENVVRFASQRPERVMHARAGQPIARILGVSSQQRRRISAADFATDDAELFTLAVAYGTTDAASLAGHAVHYWALGGEHDRRNLLSGPVTAHYCGTTQGRRPGESGQRGCTLAQVDEAGRVRSTFIPTDAVRFEQEHVVVGETTTADQLHQIMHERLNELVGDPFGPELLVQWTISGSRHLTMQLRRGNLASELVTRLRAEYSATRPGAWIISVDAQPDAAIPQEMYEEETVLGEFLRTVRHYVDNPQAELSLEPYLAERHLAGSLGSAAVLDEPAVRRRVLAQVAALGAELLSPEERAS